MERQSKGSETGKLRRKSRNVAAGRNCKRGRPAGGCAIQVRHFQSDRCRAGGGGVGNRDTCLELARMIAALDLIHPERL